MEPKAPQPVDIAELYLNTDAPYKAIYEEKDVFRRKQLLEKADLEAKERGFKKFRATYAEYVKSMEAKRSFQGMENYTDVDGQPISLNTGEWHVDAETGITRPSGLGDEVACYFPIYITRIFENIDSGVRRVELHFKTPSGRVQQLQIKCSDFATPKELVKLADMGLGINLRMAQSLSDYLTDIYALNQQIIPCSYSVGRLGWLHSGQEFSPYLREITFDGAGDYAPIFKAVRPVGSEARWVQTARHFRRESLAAHIVLAASFASVLVKPLGLLPFFVHLWGVDSSTGKTVALMAAASVWADPEMGQYVKTFDGTDVGYERTAAFLNSLPLCIDELQLSKDRHGRPLFNVYRLAQGAGRTRGTRSGGVDVTPTWANAILTTGETPLTSFGAGAGAVNRVIEIECSSESKVCNFGHEYAEQFRKNFGFAGRYFVEKLLEPGNLDRAKQLYEDAFEALNSDETTDKQAMAAAGIVTADRLATEWIFRDEENGGALTTQDVARFLASRESVSTGARAYQYLCEWVAANASHFERVGADSYAPETFGRITEDSTGKVAYIICSTFNRALSEEGFDPKAALSYLKGKGLIRLDSQGRNQVRFRVQGVLIRCVAVRLPDTVGHAEQ